ncbi:MAG: PDZ domain-containing protein, partial [Clostridia bacterium]|nr:PDZ domain-containing protein [Clostridia bacterium]
MRRLSVFFMCAAISLMMVGGTLHSVSASAAEREVYVGGMSAGFTLKTGGVQVIGLTEVISEGTVKKPAADVGMHAGDIIQKVGGIRVETITELNEIVDKSKGKALNLEVLRGAEVIEFTVQPIQEKASNRYKIGVLVRESVSGIGTV